MKYFDLHIHFPPSRETYDAITKLIGVEPIVFPPSKFSPPVVNTWKYRIERDDEDEYLDFVNVFLDLLEGKYEALEKLAVNRNDIIIWLLYNYLHQCSLEFSPQEMKRLGENGITLCIDCWETDKSRE